MITTAVLATLVGLDAARAEEVLCRAIDSLLPNVEQVELGPLERKVLAEARAASDAGDDNRATEVLTEALASYLLPAEDESRTKDDLGIRGELPLSMYELVVSWPKGRFGGVSEGEALLAVENANLVDHLTGPVLPAKERKMSAAEDLFRNAPEVAVGLAELGLQAAWPEELQNLGVTLAAHRVSEHSRGPHWLLAIMKRDAAVLTIDTAWRIFDESLPKGSVTSTRVLLGALLEQAGMPIGFPDGRKRLLVWNEELSTGAKGEPWFTPAHHRLQMTKFYAFAMSERTWFVLLGYSVDFATYKKYLNSRRAKPAGV